VQADFAAALTDAGWPVLRPGALEIFQINIGKLCNMSCRHCHVDAGPHQLAANMDRATIDACLTALDQTTAHTVDITGGAPELNPNFKYLVQACRARGKHVIDRCNLTVLLLPKHQDLPGWLAEHQVEVVASLPHHRKRNTDAQRGNGTFERSIKALRRLNDAGYGQGHADRCLTLMHNPAGAFLPADQSALEVQWKRALERDHGVTFDRLIALNNMPINRFREWLVETENLDTYMTRLVQGFNAANIAGLMCRNTLSVGWDGQLYDCDFNQMLALPLRLGDRQTMQLSNLDAKRLDHRRIVTADHCFGCTAGAGSSCGGATS
jgi:radical SAM/Cys-rich protein